MRAPVKQTPAGPQLRQEYQSSQEVDRSIPISPIQTVEWENHFWKRSVRFQMPMPKMLGRLPVLKLPHLDYDYSHILKLEDESFHYILKDLRTPTDGEYDQHFRDIIHNRTYRFNTGGTKLCKYLNSQLIWSEDLFVK